MRVSAEIEVERGDDMVTVSLEGRFENYGSYNPHERGLGLGDWDVSAPTGFVLTPDERESAVQALYNEAGL